ncbi:MAG: AMP-binding protein, partial [Terriglobia bacterium]
MSEQQLLTDYLANFGRHGSGIAFITSRGYRQERVSYREIAGAACQFGHELASRKIGKGERVLIWGYNCAEWVIAFLGSIQNGAVPVPLDAFATPDFAASVIRGVTPSLVVCSRRLVCSLRDSNGLQRSGFSSFLAPGEPSSAIPVPLLGGVSGVPLIEFERLREIISRHPPTRQPFPSLLPDDPLEIIFTSGATSEPRGVVITHGNIQSNLAPFKPEIEKYLKYERFFHPIRFLNLVPLSHVFG